MFQELAPLLLLANNTTTNENVTRVHQLQLISICSVLKTLQWGDVWDHIT